MPMLEKPMLEKPMLKGKVRGAKRMRMARKLG